MTPKTMNIIVNNSHLMRSTLFTLNCERSLVIDRSSHVRRQGLMRYQRTQEVQALKQHQLLRT